MKFNTAYTALAFSTLVAAVSLHNGRLHQNHRRELDIVTITDIVWDVVTVTEYDLPAEATTTASSAQIQADLTTQTQGTTTSPEPTSQADSVATAATSSTLEAVYQAALQATTLAAEAAASVSSPSSAQDATSVAPLVTPTTSSSPEADVASAVEAAPTTLAPAVQTTPEPTPTTTSSSSEAEVASAVEAAPTTLAPTIQTTPEPTTTSTSPVPAATTAATSSASGEYSGDGTYYELGLTACGQTYSDSDYVAAISYLLFDQDGTANPNNNPHCGKKIRVYHGGASVDVTIVDRCAGCEKEYSVDLSPTAFQVLAPESDGRIDITWNYI